jgi:endonuclease/exonuclease/phosphatase family metal-dependent hydrolase
MHSKHRNPTWQIILIILVISISVWSRDCYTVATYNLENYLDVPTGTRRVKGEASKAKIRESIRTINPDVLAVQEMGAVSALHELRSALQEEGLHFPYWEHVRAWDTNICVAIFSKYPIVERRSHTDAAYVLDRRILKVSRGFGEVDIRINEEYVFTLITAHLKSKRPVAVANEAEMREKEAEVLRSIIDARFEVNPQINLVLLGDLNDYPDSRAVRMLKGRGKKALLDTRPYERNGDNSFVAKSSRYAPRNIAWTHHYGVQDIYTRVDYIMLSPGMAHEWIKNESYILDIANWGVASDHRPLVAVFYAHDL